jgi:microcystin-dependent protein
VSATPKAATGGTGPEGNLLAQSGGQRLYGAAADLAHMAPDATGSAGLNQPHQNMQPFLTLTFCMAMVGIFPSQN